MKTGSVLYVISPARIKLDTQFEHAQTDALERKLPLAVVSCVPANSYSEKLPALQALETALDRAGIPFMVLIGEEAAVLSSIMRHAKPVKVYGQSVSGGETGVNVKLHPYKWPGIVIKTEELKKIVDKNDYMC